MQHIWRSSVWFLVSVRCRSGACFASAAGGEAEERSHVLRPIPTRLHQTTAPEHHRASERSRQLQTSRGLSYERPLQIWSSDTISGWQSASTHTLKILSLPSDRLQSFCSSGTCVWFHRRDTQWVFVIRYVHYREGFTLVTHVITITEGIVHPVCSSSGHLRLWVCFFIRLGEMWDCIPMEVNGCRQNESLIKTSQ